MNIRNIFILIATIIILCSIHCFITPRTNIITIESFAQANDILANADANTLVLFDVDDTLIMPASKIFWPRLQSENAEWMNTTLKEVFEREKKSDDYYLDIWRTTELPIVIEPIVIDLIKSLQNRNIQVLALTALDTGSSELIPSFPEWRWKTLSLVGIDFSKTNLPDMKFTELSHGHNENPPVLYKGILASSSVPKGDTLGAFLNHLPWKPDRIIFFDNNIKYLESVEEEMKKRSIPFYGFHYLGAKQMKGELDKEVALIQLNHLIDSEEWISEQEAREVLTTNT